MKMELEKRREIERLYYEIMEEWGCVAELFFKMEGKLLSLMSVLEELGYMKDANDVDTHRWSMAREMRKIMMIVRRVLREVSRSLE